jgi:integrase
LAKVLTVAAVKKYAATGKRRFIKDAGSKALYLVVQGTGHKSWVMRFRKPGGTAAKITLGALDLSGRELSDAHQVGQPLSLAAARQLAAAIHRDRAMGRDPIAEHRARRHRRMAEAASRDAGAFPTLAKKFIVEHAAVKTKHWRDTAKLLGLNPDDNLEPIPNGLAERWVDRDAAKIDAHDVHSAIDEAHRISAPGIAPRRPGLSESRPRALHAALSSFFHWGLQHRHINANPCASVWKPRAAAARDRVLNAEEIRVFWKATEAVGEPFGSVLRLLLLTGARLNEIARLRRDELNGTGTEIHLPKERSKNRCAHTIPLSPRAREIIAEMSKIAGSAFIFTTSGRVPIIVGSKIKNRLDAAMGDVPPWRVHDLRRTTVTGLGEMGIAPHIIELTINHAGGSRAGVAGTYNKSELLPERRSALDRWANHVAGLVADKPVNVTRLQPRKA